MQDTTACLRLCCADVFFDALLWFTFLVAFLKLRAILRWNFLYRRTRRFPIRRSVTFLSPSVSSFCRYLDYSPFAEVLGELLSLLRLAERDTLVK